MLLGAGAKKQNPRVHMKVLLQEHLVLFLVLKAQSCSSALPGSMKQLWGLFGFLWLCQKLSCGWDGFYLLQLCGL